MHDPEAAKARLLHMALDHPETFTLLPNGRIGLTKWYLDRPLFKQWQKTAMLIKAARVAMRYLPPLWPPAQRVSAESRTPQPPSSSSPGG